MHSMFSIVGENFFEFPGIDAVCHRIMHIAPRDDLGDFDIRFGTNYIVDKLYDAAVTGLDMYLGAALEKTARGVRAKLVGMGFECFAHRRLAKGGVFKVRELLPDPSAPGHTVDSRFRPREPQVFRRHADVCAADLGPDTYGCMPDGYPAVDALAWADGADKSHLYMFQMTVNPDHGITTARLLEVLHAMKVMPKEACLFWVVPQDMFEDFPVQVFKNTTGEERSKGLPEGLGFLKQLVLAIDLTSEVQRKGKDG